MRDGSWSRKNTRRSSGLGWSSYGDPLQFVAGGEEGEDEAEAWDGEEECVDCAEVPAIHVPVQWTSSDRPTRKNAAADHADGTGSAMLLAGVRGVVRRVLCVASPPVAVPPSAAVAAVHTRTRHHTRWSATSSDAPNSAPPAAPYSISRVLLDAVSPESHSSAENSAVGEAWIWYATCRAGTSVAEAEEVAGSFQEKRGRCVSTAGGSVNRSAWRDVGGGDPSAPVTTATRTASRIIWETSKGSQSCHARGRLSRK